MRNRLAIFGLLFFAGCGMFRDKELPATAIKVSPAPAECQLPEPFDQLVEAKQVTEPMVISALDCIRTQLDSGFKQVRGQTAGELSIGELKTLQREGVINLRLTTPEHWRILEKMLPLWHPANRPALSQARTHEILAWLRKHTGLYVATLKKMYESGGILKFDRYSDLALAIEEMLPLMNSQWRLTLSEGLSLVDDHYEIQKTSERPTLKTVAELRQSVEAVWILKSLVLADPEGAGARGDLRADSLKELISFAAKIAQDQAPSREWGLDRLPHDKIPPTLPEDWARAGKLGREYFTGHQFAPIDQDLLAWALRALAPANGMASLSGDVVRLGRRLAPDSEEAARGLHPTAFLPLLAALRPTAEDILQSGARMTHVDPEGRGYLSLGEALKDPLLRRVAIKGGKDVGRISPEQRLGPAKEFPLFWETITGRLAKRRVTQVLFKAFHAGTGGIKLHGDTPEELSESIELAFSFLRFASALSTTEEGTGSYLIARPKSVYSTLGLLGDRWMSDGNQNGELDAEEFYSVVEVFSEIQDRASSSLMQSGSAYHLEADVGRYNWVRAGAPSFYARKELVKNMARGFEFYLPDMDLALKGMPKARLDSFFHGLVGITKHTPIKVVKHNNRGNLGPRMLSYYASGDDALPAAAILVTLEKLMIRCDLNEDKQFDWQELDCAAPLMLEAGLQIVQSALVDLDPGVNDTARVLLSYLQRPGVPLSVAKVALANGSFQEFNLADQEPAIDKWLQEEGLGDWKKIVDFGKALLPDEGDAAKIKDHYLKCDLDKNGVIDGLQELECVEKLAQGDLNLSITRLLGTVASKVGIEKFLWMSQSPLFRKATLVGLLDEKKLNGMLSRVPLKSSPTKILLLLEELLRRSVPVENTPDE
jgi:hypothetical protein